MTLTGAEVRAIRAAMKLSQRELADTLDVTVRTIRRWETNGGSKYATAALGQWKEEIEG